MEYFASEYLLRNVSILRGWNVLFVNDIDIVGTVCLIIIFISYGFQHRE